jgi:uncharacterized protein YbjT (DUF2867 family)
MRIVVLGSTGQVGSVITKVLREQLPAAEVLGAVRKLTGRSNEIVFEPFLDDWSKLGKVDVLVNSIGIIQETKSMSFEKAHVDLARVILENRSKTGNPRIINMSVLGVEKELDSPFLETKRKADMMLLAQADTYIIRPSIVCTPNTVIVQKFRMLKRMSRLTFHRLIFPSGFLKTRIQPVLGEDIGEVIARLCERANAQREIILSGPETFTIGDLLKSMDPRIVLVPFSQKLFNSLFSAGSKVFPSLLNPEQFKLLQSDNVGDNSVAEKILNRTMTSTRAFWKEELK